MQEGLDRHHGSADEVALRRKVRVSGLLLVDRDSIGILELFVVVARLLAAQQFREELDAARPVDGIQED
ncbi:MAG: hypothetical protein IJS62_05275, partial [Bacteroidales bacterium]|nr:hypothetical protein [Bacteroidales bacterium]